MNDYIRLVSSDSSLAKRFRVIREGYSPIREKVGAHRSTITGKTDNQVGPILRKWRYVILVYATDPVSSDYGTLANLRTFFNYNSPGGTPTNVITLEDFDFDDTAVDFSVYIIGSLAEKPLGPLLAGTDGIFNVALEMMEVAA